MLCGLQDGEHSGCTAEMENAALVGGDMLVVTDARTEVVAEFVVTATEAFRRSEALEPAHTSDVAFYAPVILFEPIVSVSAGAVGDPLA